MCLWKQKITLNNYELKFKGTKILPVFFGSFFLFFLKQIQWLNILTNHTGNEAKPWL